FEIAMPIALATGGGNALPTCRYSAVLRPANCHESGNPCRRATIRVVSLGTASAGKDESGGSSAMPRPSTPSSSHAARALVGPGSGPPCFLLPPTIVGAMPAARATHWLAPGQPPAAIRSARVSPTDGAAAADGTGQA